MAPHATLKIEAALFDGAAVACQFMNLGLLKNSYRFVGHLAGDVVLLITHGGCLISLDGGGLCTIVEAHSIGPSRRNYTQNKQTTNQHVGRQTARLILSPLLTKML